MTLIRQISALGLPRPHYWSIGKAALSLLLPCLAIRAAVYARIWQDEGLTVGFICNPQKPQKPQNKQ